VTAAERATVAGVQKALDEADQAIKARGAEPLLAGKSFPAEN